MEENQQEPILRSIHNRCRSYVTFVNSTLHNVSLYWIDYEGRAIGYGDLFPGHYVDIDTFVTHPWIFVDKETKDRYMVNHNDVFFPEPPKRIGRTCAYITIPLYTLREMSLRAIKKYLRHYKQAFLLDIPRNLQFELAAMLPKTEDVIGGRNSPKHVDS